jgi:hypothetical protein
MTHQRVEALLKGHSYEKPLRLEESKFQYVSMPIPWMRAEDASMMEELSEFCKRVGVTDGIVFIDTLKDVTIGVDENSPIMGDVISNFRRLSEDLNSAIVIIHHPRKGSYGYDDEGSESFRGYSGIVGKVDVGLKVRRKGFEDVIRIFSGKSRQSVIEPFGARWSFKHHEGTTDLKEALFYGHVLDLPKKQSLRLAISDSLWEYHLTNPDIPMNKGHLIDAVREEYGRKFAINKIEKEIDLMVGEEEILQVDGPSPAGKYYDLTSLERSTRRISEEGLEDESIS